MASMKIKKGDMVKVIAGRDKDKEGKVIAVNKKDRDAPLGIAGHILRVGGLRGRLQGLPGNFPVNTACIGIQDFLDGIIAVSYTHLT